jgi:hypothetical protein
LADLEEELLLAGKSTKARKVGGLIADVSEGVRRVRGHVDRLVRRGGHRLTSEGDLDLSLEDAEHLFEVVPVWRRAPAGWHVYVDQRVGP